VNPSNKGGDSNPSAARSLGEKIGLKRAKRIKSCPVSCRGLLARCFSKKASPRQAIKAQCHDCCGFDRPAITECTAFGCPLWNLRPYQQEGQ
jgi:hypothetical protein